MTNVLTVAMIPPAAVTTSQMAKMAPRTVPMIRLTYQLCGEVALAEPSAFGTLLRSLRVAAGLTQEELAERAERAMLSPRSAAVMVQVPVRRAAIVRLWTTAGASALRSVACRAACIPSGRR